VRVRLLVRFSAETEERGTKRLGSLVVAITEISEKGLFKGDVQGTIGITVRIQANVVEVSGGFMLQFQALELETLEKCLHGLHAVEAVPVRSLPTCVQYKQIELLFLRPQFVGISIW